VNVPARDPWTLVALAAFFSLLVAALFGARLAPHEPIYFVVEHGSDPRPYDPGVVFPFGSDVLGRDLLSLTLAGAQTTLAVVLLGGLARVFAGVLIAAISSWWRPTRLATESVAELVSAVPATLVALVLVKVFVKSDTTIWVFIGALLVMGWAGPYRVIRAEIDRLARAPFTQGAVTMGVGRTRLFLRHHLPHLAPVIALNLSQQIVAALVLVAELGVLGTFAGGTRTINVQESMTLVRTGLPTVALVADVPEWGGLLAGARTVEALWTTRWLILVPGVAFAITAVAVAAIGFALARRYARRDVTDDLRRPGALALGVACVGLFAVSGLVPERYATARDWAAAVRAEVRPITDVAASFASGGLRPLSAGYEVRRDVRAIVQTGAGMVTVGGVTLAEPWPREEDPLPGIPKPHARAFVSVDTGGGSVEAPLVYVGRGIAPADFPPQVINNPFSPGDLGTFVKEYADDYAGVDVRGKVVLVVRFLGVAGPRRDRLPNGYLVGPSGDEQIKKAIARGAAAVIFVDPALSYYADQVKPFTTRSGELTGGINPYSRYEKTFPPGREVGVPVMLIDDIAAQQLLAGMGVDLSEVRRFDDRTPDKYRVSPARELGLSARVTVPLQDRTASVTSFVGESDGVSTDTGRVLLWTERRLGADNARDVLGAAARALGARHTPFIFVEFDPAIDAIANRKAVREVLKDRRITLVIVLDRIEGTALKITTPYGDLIPAFDHYADQAGARHELTRTTSGIGAIEDVTPFPDLPTVLITGVGGHGDLRPDAAAVVGYLAGRLALGAAELPR
jgi:peptide/nickel transport system permease protein